MDEDMVAEVERAMTRWRSTHPHATFAEIEQAVEEQITRIRVQLLEQVVAAGPTQERPLCPSCGGTMVPRRQGDRQVTIRGDGAVHLDRSYGVCPSCGTGLFPPR
jgi:YgiT-type zinc finger domain-containing protein